MTTQIKKNKSRISDLAAVYYMKLLNVNIEIVGDSMIKGITPVG